MLDAVSKLLHFGVTINSNQMKKIFFTILLLLPCPVLAQEDLTQGIWKGLIQEEINNENSSGIFKPALDGGLVTDLNFDHNYNSTQSQNNYNSISARSIFASKLAISQNFSLQSVFRLDEVSKNDSQFATNSAGGNVVASNGSNRYFADEALRAEEITANYSNKNFSVLAGKFVPNFGVNWKWGRGIWSQNLANNYRQTQKVGAGLSYKVGSRQKTGQYNFGFATFTNDRSSLNNSLLSQSAPYNKTAGDASGLLQSYVGSMDILFDFGKEEKLSYHFSYINLGVNSNLNSGNINKTADQKGYSAAMNYRYPISENLVLDSLLEYVRMKNVGGDSDIGEQYYNASLVTEIHRNWNVTLANTTLVHSQLGYNGYDQSLSEISLGYNFGESAFFDKLLIQIGYKNFRTNYKTSVDENNSVGALLRYIKSF